MENRNYFIITTDKETALKVEKFFQSPILSQNRSLALGKINHNPGYSDVQIISTKENGLIEPKDVFWLGIYSATL